MWRAIEKYGVEFCRYYLGGFNLVSGLNYFFLFWPQPVVHDVSGNEFVIAAMKLKLFTFAKILEIIGGLTLVTNRFVPLGLVLLMPVTALSVEDLPTPLRPSTAVIFPGFASMLMP